MQILLKELKRYFRDRTAVFSNILLPIILTFLLGTFLSSLYVSQPPIDTINIQYVSSSTDTSKSEALEGFLTELNDDTTFNIKITDDINQATEQLRNQEIDALIELRGNPIVIVLHPGLDTLKNQVINSVLEGYVLTDKLITDIAITDPALLGDLTLSDQEFISNDGTKLNGFSILDYYGIAMIVMTAFMGSSMVGAGIYYDERIKNTLIRLHASPKNKLVMFFSTSLASLPQAMLQVLIIMGFNVLVFNVKYCDTLQDNVILFSMLVTVTLAMIAVGQFIGIIIKRSPMTIILSIVWPMLFFSGSFAKDTIIDGFSNYLPPYLIQQAAFDLTLFSESAAAFTVLFISIAVFVVFNILGAIIFSNGRDHA